MKKQFVMVGVVIAFVCGIACFPSPQPPSKDASHYLMCAGTQIGYRPKFELFRSMSTRQVQAVVENAVSRKCSVIFIHVAWSSYSTYARPIYADFTTGFHRRYPRKDVAFHYVDCTNRETDLPIRKLTGTLQNIATDPISTNGDGTLIWIKNGKIVCVNSTYDFHSNLDFCRFANRVFYEH